MGTDSSNDLRGILIMGEPVNWVKNRQECTIHRIFKHSLWKQVEKDVGQAGEYFELIPGATEFLVKDKAHPLRSTSFQLMKDRIRVEPSDAEPFCVAHHWNDATATCSLRVEGEDADIELWQISQRALGKLFFG